ncbi:NAD(P)/FAD-dependent oxidoreductase [Nonomuraea typhae]|uniref:NAD(P)/FAD-dependent oxidoreductase n=1 Tax=Nonomuraea typhae TaxID=2603600 RepID=UPI0012FAA668|nr:FAD-dependent oxidoreductase [Nonomuraea typhae]
MSEGHTDVLVIGAGVIGASSACHLARAGRRVVVAESFAGPAEGSTGRSFASVRGQWAGSLNIELSWRSIQRYRSFATDVGYRPTGYLLLVPDAAWAAQQEAVRLQRRHGVPVELLDTGAAARITPFDPSGIAGAAWGPADGVVDPHLVTCAFLDLARAAGARVLFRHPVTAAEADEGTGGWRVTAGGRVWLAQHVVNAAGGWAGEAAALAGLSVPVVHSRRNVYATAPDVLRAPLPLTIDVGSGAVVRGEGSRVLFYASRPDQSDGYDVSVDWSWMEPALERVAGRFPWIADLPLDRRGCWAGTYENTPDHAGVLGPDPSAPTWINACGFSGHGLMQAPEIGRLVAEQVVTGAITSLDVTSLRLERFADPAYTARAELVF